MIQLSYNIDKDKVKKNIFQKATSYNAQCSSVAKLSINIVTNPQPMEHSYKSASRPQINHVSAK